MVQRDNFQQRIKTLVRDPYSRENYSKSSPFSRKITKKVQSRGPVETHAQFHVKIRGPERGRSSHEKPRRGPEVTHAQFHVKFVAKGQNFEVQRDAHDRGQKSHFNVFRRFHEIPVLNKF